MKRQKFDRVVTVLTIVLAVMVVGFIFGSRSILRAQDETPTAIATITPELPPPVDPVEEQPRDLTPTEVLALVLALAASVERFTNILKPFVLRLKLEDDVYTAVIQAISVGLGVVIALASNQRLNLLSGLPLVPPLMGIVITGGIAGFGSSAAHAAFDLVFSWRDANEQKAANLKAQAAATRDLSYPASNL